MLKKIIENWKKAQDNGIELPCPRCGHMKMKKNPTHNCLSRRADVYICSTCGTQESLEDFQSKNANTHSEQYKAEKLSTWFVSKTICNNAAYEKVGEDGYKVNVSRSVVLSMKDIDDIMCCALEGGITYWACDAEVVEDEYFGEFAHEQISRGGSLRIYDAEDDEVYTLDLDKFLKGFAIACKDGYGDDWFCGDGVDLMNAGELYSAMRKENDEFEKELLSKSPQEVYDAAYEISVRNDILSIIGSCDDSIPGSHCKALLRSETPLSDLYNAWLKHEDDFMEQLTNFIEQYARSKMFKKCRFCGSSDVNKNHFFAHGIEHYAVKCNSCGGSTGTYGTIEEATAAWNGELIK